MLTAGTHAAGTRAFQSTTEARVPLDATDSDLRLFCEYLVTAVKLVTDIYQSLTL